MHAEASRGFTVECGMCEEEHFDAGTASATLRNSCNRDSGAVFLVASSNALAAVTSQWSTNGGGDFSNPANWENSVPGPADTATFARGNVAYTVQFTGSIVINKFARH